eukprot:CAMPEP_0196590076 /NCGR_PEP_ID=MMETSP1081-20130531/65477_1 /TAXON_ID=36882 /ORGANISM="Pyramimonas amylifera, Strain CCMP720" /LENGTH=350 /DNA_ID=CAMNT_0041913059 /DNA_START=370 /DNA_END=1422 /DNA_ORIENTATION=+
MCANNYLGLSADPLVMAAAREALESHGYGLASVRFICGTQDLHTKLERQLSGFHRKEDTILYASCFDANAGLFEALLSKEDAVISDQLNHASIIDGVRLCKAQRFRYLHTDMEDLERKLVEAKDARVKLIATDGVFSMDGSVAPLRDICDLAKKHSALVMVDDCHATGVLGKGGRGTPEYWGVEDQVDIVNSTLGKALGGATGGYTSGRRDVVEMLRQKSRPYLFSNTLAPAVVGASLEVLRQLRSSSDLRDKLEDNTSYFRTRIKEAGYRIKGSDHSPIVPVMLDDAKLAGEVAQRMLREGVYVVAFSYPVVPQGQARIRVQVSAAHSKEQLDHAVEAFIRVGKEFSII